MANNAPALYTANDVVVPHGFTESVDLLIQTYAQDLTPSEFSLAIASAHNRGLSIVKKQIYFWKIGGKVVEVIGIDGYRSQAEDSSEYAGQDGPFWCGDDGVWRDVWLSSSPPVAAKVGVLRRGFQQPIYEIALWAEYFVNSNPSWKKYPTVMIAKCAEARAIRKAFPDKLGGTYTSDEIDRRGAVETTGTVRKHQPREVKPATATVEDPDRDEARKQLWHLADKTYGWDLATLDAVAVDAMGRGLKELDAAGLRDLNMTLVTEGPEDRQQRVDRATAIDAPQLDGMS